MVNGPKYCSRLNDSPFTTFIDPCEHNSGWKNFSEWYAKSSHCLLTHWLLIISILFRSEAVYSYIFRCKDFRNEIYFLIFFLHFLNLNEILKIFKKKKRWPSWLTYFWTYGMQMKWLEKCVKSPEKRTLRQVTWQTSPSTVQSWKTAPLPSSFIPLMAIQVHKISLSNMQILRTVC